MQTIVENETQPDVQEPVLPPETEAAPRPARRKKRLWLRIIFNVLIVLLLLSMLEALRMFQAWFMLQNAASTAIRYATTGAYDAEKYDIDLLLPCHIYDPDLLETSAAVPMYTPAGQPEIRMGLNVYAPPTMALEPPISDYEVLPVSNMLLDSGAGQPAPKDIMFMNQPRRAYEDIYHSSGILILERGQTFTPEAITVLAGQTVKVLALNPDESLYATWYGRDKNEDECYPSQEALDSRMDMLRLASIYDTARRGAAGLLLEPALTGSGSRAEFARFLRDFWSNPSPRQMTPGWFNVMICSARVRRYPTDETVMINNNDDPASKSADLDLARLRFETFEGQGIPYTGALPMPGGACLLKEQPKPNAAGYMLNNYNQSWADAGDAGDKVTIMLTFNHPLIFLPGQYIQLQARRSARNEDFRYRTGEITTRWIGPSGSGMPEFITPTPYPALPVYRSQGE